MFSRAVLRVSGTSLGFAWEAAEGTRALQEVIGSFQGQGMRRRITLREVVRVLVPG